MKIPLDKDGLPDMYWLKWRFLHQENLVKASDKGWHYGIQVQFDKTAEKHWRDKGYLTIEDAITGRTYMIDPRTVDIVEFKGDDWPSEYDKFLEAEHKKALVRSNKAKGLVGKTFSLDVADGLAWYEVVAETARKVKIEWRGYCADRWHNQVLGWGGTFDKSTIKPLCREKFNMKAWRGFPT